MSDEKEKSRLETAVPKPPVQNLDERQKQALELAGEAEHAHGDEREKLTKKAGQLGDSSRREDAES